MLAAGLRATGGVAWRGRRAIQGRVVPVFLPVVTVVGDEWTVVDEPPGAAVTWKVPSAIAPLSPRASEDRLFRVVERAGSGPP